MRDPCPNQFCPHFQSNAFVKKDGRYFRRDDSRFILRFKCIGCRKRFSATTKSLEYRQKKRRFNQQLFGLLASGVSQRRSALLLHLHRTTIYRKFLYLAKKSSEENALFLGQFKNNPISHIQMDDLITSEHSKLKPLSVSIAVNVKTRHILSVKVGQIAAFGHLAKLSRRKYGHRKSQHLEKLDELFINIKGILAPNVLIETDEHKNYPVAIKAHLPSAIHSTYKSSRAAIVGQGELKKLKFDPLFNINHTAAMLRANLNRLFRRTWSTTKKAQRLQDHLELFICFYHQKLI